MTEHRLLATYLNDHLVGATAGLELFRRVAAQHEGSDIGAEVSRLAEEAEEDRDALRAVMDRLGVPEKLPMVAIGWLGEKLGRLKPNGYLVRRSPLADVIELEGLRDAVAAKIAGWQVLRAVAVHDSRLSKEELETLLERAQDQADRLYRLHLRVTEARLAPGGGTDRGRATS